MNFYYNLFLVTKKTFFFDVDSNLFFNIKKFPKQEKIFVYNKSSHVHKKAKDRLSFVFPTKLELFFTNISQIKNFYFTKNKIVDLFYIKLVLITQK